MKARTLLVGLVALAAMQGALAAIDLFEFSSESLRDRYHQLIEVLRCPKCQNQNLAGSDSPIAADLRREIHRMLEEGFTDVQIKQFLVDRYGEFVLYEPPKSGTTLLVWVLPPALAGLGLLTLALILWRARRQALASGNLQGDNEF